MTDDTTLPPSGEDDADDTARDGGMIVLKKLREKLEKQLNMTAVMSPNNALSRRSVKISPGAPKLSRLPVNPQRDFEALEMLVNVQITVTLSGANAGDFLASQILQTGTALHCFLTEDLFIIHEVDQELSLLRHDTSGHYIRTCIVGDAELVGARRINYGVTNDAEPDKHSDKLHVWTETWGAQLVMTLHRYFHNPLLKEVTYTDERTGEELIVNGDNN